jgi:hypothetical protein
VDHLAEQKDSLAIILLNCLVADFNRVLNAITKTKMSGEQKLDRAKID